MRESAEAKGRMKITGTGVPKVSDLDLNMYLLWKQAKVSFSFQVLNSITSHYLVAQMVTNLPAMQETWVRPLGWEDPMEEGMATHSSVLAWRTAMDRGAWKAAVHGVAQSWTRLSN